VKTLGKAAGMASDLVNVEALTRLGSKPGVVACSEGVVACSEGVVACIGFVAVEGVAGERELPPPLHAVSPTSATIENETKARRSSNDIDARF
jgi:hypothetical protein